MTQDNENQSTGNQYTDTQLDAFLDEALAVDQMEQLEAALARDAALAQRVAEAAGRRDAGLHTLGAIWRRHRLTCPTRQELGSYLLGVLPDDQASHIRLHIEEASCRYCQASVADLRDQHAATDQQEQANRRTKYFQSSVGHLKEEG